MPSQKKLEDGGDGGMKSTVKMDEKMLALRVWVCSLAIKTLLHWILTDVRFFHHHLII